MVCPRVQVPSIRSEFEGARLGDPRRALRLQAIAESLASNSSAPLTRVAGSDGETEGLYRFMRNPNVTFEAVLEPHSRATVERIAGSGVPLVLHDTSDFSFEADCADDLGYLPTGQRGFRSHVSLAATLGPAVPVPLGVLAVQNFFREEPPAARGKGKKRNQSGEDYLKNGRKEVGRWLDQAVQVDKLLEPCGKAVHVMDREGDSYERFADLHEAGLLFVIRCKRIERRARPAGAEGDWSSLAEVLAEAEYVTEREVYLGRRLGHSAPRAARLHKPRDGRPARLLIARTTIELPRPRSARPDCPETLKIQIVRVWEGEPPPGEEPVEWWLATNLPVDTQAEVELVVDAYRARWLIEEFFKAIKTGCAYKMRRLESRHALLNLLAVTMPVASRMVMMRTLGRNAPDTPATGVLDETELEVLRVFSHRKMPAEPTVWDAMLAIAALGGHLKNNGPPGWQVLARGFEAFLTLHMAWVAAREHFTGANKTQEN